MKVELRLSFGACSLKLKEQLKSFKLDKESVKHWQQSIDACNRLRIRGLLTRSESGKCENRLFKKIAKEVEKTLK